MQCFFLPCGLNEIHAISQVLSQRNLSPRNNIQQGVKALFDIEGEFYDSLEQSVSTHANAFCLDLPKHHSELPDFTERVKSVSKVYPKSNLRNGSLGLGPALNVSLINDSRGNMIMLFCKGSIEKIMRHFDRGQSD